MSLILLSIAGGVRVIAAFCGGMRNMGKAKEMAGMIFLFSMFFGVISAFFWVP